MKLKKLNAAVLAGLAGYSLSMVATSTVLAEEAAEENVEKLPLSVPVVPLVQSPVRRYP